MISAENNTNLAMLVQIFDLLLVMGKKAAGPSRDPDCCAASHAPEARGSLPISESRRTLLIRQKITLRSSSSVSAEQIRQRPWDG